MKYICTNSFDSQNGKVYSYGREISSSEYNDLYYSEQDNFEESDEDDDSLLEDIVGIGLGVAISSLLDNDEDSDDSSIIDDIGGLFGGGKSGGGGAGGSW